MRRNEDVGLAGCALLLVAIAGTTVLNTVVNGFVVATLWRWFVVPALGLRPISYGAAAGITLLVAFMRLKIEKKDDDTVWDLIADIPRRTNAMLITAVLCLAAGYVIQRVWL
jgi:hypothetical protein